MQDQTSQETNPAANTTPPLVGRDPGDEATPTNAAAQYERWVREAERDHRANLAAYECPSCRTTLKTPVPTTSQPYDTLTVCPYCLTTFLKVVTRGGRVRLTKLDSTGGA
jgi:hypothetical protein